MPDDRPHLNIQIDDVLRIGRMLRDLKTRWWICGGWAIDLYLGRVTRSHADLEIGIARADQALLHDRLPDRQLIKIVEGALLPWPREEFLELPVHQVVVRQPGAQPPEFEFFLNEVTGGRWHFRRDPQIHRPIHELCVLTSRGISVLAPEVQLLFKARYHREKDEHDFRTVLPYLDPPRRLWLRNALQRHLPQDPWLAELSG